MKKANNGKALKPLSFTDEEIKKMLSEIGKKHRNLNNQIFDKEGFRAKIDKGDIILTSMSARSVLFNGKLGYDVKVVFDSTEENEIKKNYPEYYDKVTTIHKAIMSDIANIWQPGEGK